MVSTPIGPVLPPDMSQMSKPPLSSNSQTYLPPLNTVPLPVIPNSTAPLLQPTLQPGMPYMPNLFVPAGPHHTFPVLYNQQPVVPATTPPTEVQPMSLYAEYMGNPYNVTPVENFRLENENKVGEVGNQTNETQPPSIPTDTSNLTSNDNDVGRTVTNNNNADFDRVANNNGVAASYFQSSNYFSSQIDATIPPGSEILYATQGIRAQGGICASSSGSKISDI